MIYTWFTTDAQWWQFWMPKSGPAFGIILGNLLGNGISLTFLYHLTH